MKKFKMMLFMLGLAVAQSLLAQGNEDEALTQMEAVQLGLYPPQILIRMQDQLGVTEEQRSRISALLADFNTQVSELQWSMPSEQQRLRELTSQKQVDADAASAQAQKLLELETRFKLAHIELLVAIKNELTDEQIESLNQIIRQRMSRLRSQQQ